jgi:dihydroflavonol-4-reductase
MDGLAIVTGGAGFIGSHLVEWLVDSGQAVRVVERPGAGVDHLPPGVDVVFVDIRDRAGLVRAMEGGRWVYHLAANPNLWVRDRDEFRAVNYEGTINVLDTAYAVVEACSTPVRRAS